MSASPASEHDHLLPADDWPSSDGESTVVTVERFPGSELNNRKNGSLVHQVALPALRRPFPPEKRKTLLAFVLLSINLILNLSVLAFIHDRVPDRSTSPPLPDIFFDLFQPRDWALDVSEIIIIGSVWTVILLLLAHKHRFIILRRVFLIMAIVYFFRSLTMLVTQLPVASTTYYCSPKANHTSAALIARRVLQLMGGLGLSINGLHTYCGDYIFSGHTVVLVLASLVVAEYASPRCCRLLPWLSAAASTTGVVMVLLARGHYTVDVLIAYYITTRVFWNYHTLAANKASKHKLLENKNYLTRVGWHFLFQYFERNVEGTVPCQFELPLPSSLKKLWCCRRTRAL